MDTTLLEKEEMKKELIQMAKKSQIKKKLIGSAVVVGVVLITIFVACLFVRNNVNAKRQGEIDELKQTIEEMENQIDELIDTPIVVNPVAPEIVLGILESEIKDISELATYEYLFSDSASFKDSKQIKNWNIPFTQKSFTLRWSGVIKAGVDLEQVSVEVIEAEKKIIVSVPLAEILSYEVDQNSVEVLDEKDNLFNKLTIEDKVKFDAETEEAMKERAIENGILEKAQENAEMILTKLFFTNPDIKSYYTLEFVVKE